MLAKTVADVEAARYSIVLTQVENILSGSYENDIATAFGYIMKAAEILTLKQKERTVECLYGS